MFDATLAMDDPGPRYNIAPTLTVAALRGGPERELVGLRWGLIPAWAEDPRALPLMINARAESLDARASFRDLLADRRCAVLADGFYEWRTEHGVRQPYFIRRKDGKPMAFAALWDRHADADGATESCVIVTTDANELLAPLHERMPAILATRSLAPWLEPTMHDFERVRGALAPFRDAPLVAWPVGTRVNRAGEEDAELVTPLGEPVATREGWSARPSGERRAPDPQLGLFEAGTES